MVASAGNYCIADNWNLRSYWRRFSAYSIYLSAGMSNKSKMGREKDLETILVLCTFFALAYFGTKQQHQILLMLSILLGLTGIFSKYLSSKIAWLWLKFSELLGSLSSMLMLSLVFYVLLVPIALLQKLFAKNNYHKKPQDGSSYYFSRNHKYEAKDMENPW